MEFYDKDRDGKIDYDEFKAAHSPSQGEPRQDDGGGVVQAAAGGGGEGAAAESGLVIDMTGERLTRQMMVGQPSGGHTKGRKVHCAVPTGQVGLATYCHRRAAMQHTVAHMLTACWPCSRRQRAGRWCSASTEPSCRTLAGSTPRATSGGCTTKPRLLARFSRPASL